MNFRLILLSVCILCFCCAQQSCVNKASADANAIAPIATWTSIEEAAELSKTNDKKMLVDIYTDWCKWCKEMDKQTFSNSSVKSYLAKNYNLAKLNAEQKKTILFNNKEYKWVQGSRNGYNQLANEILDGRMAYPSVAVFDSKGNKLEVIRGFKSPEQLMTLLQNAEL